MSIGRFLPNSIPFVRFAKGVVWRGLTKLKGDPDSFLKHVKGVIHVGANLGQERDVYAKHALNVLWIEPIPEIYRQLTVLIAPFPNQKALCALITDTDDQENILHISNNEGCSSSIFDLAEHKKLWPEIAYTSEMKMNSISLTTLVRREGVDMGAYDALVMDTQGSELLVLKGAVEILPRFRFVKAEVADFDSYKGCCRLPEMDAFFRQQGYRRVMTTRFAHMSGVGAYYNVVYSLKK